MNGRKIWWLLPLLLVGIVSAWFGLPPSRVPTGGDLPVTVARLQNSRLVPIGSKQTLSVSFSEATVVVMNNDQPIPEFWLAMFVPDASKTVRRVEASWDLDETRQVLRLTNLMVDGQATNREVNLPIRPAGQVRLNLAGEQFNRFRITDDLAPASSSADSNK